MAYQRVLRVDMSGFTLDEQGLRVAFSVRRDKSRDPDSAEIAVWNLNEDTRRELEQGAQRVVSIEAGHADETVGQIFTGIVHNVQSVHENEDWITHLSLVDDNKDGDRVRLRRVHRSFAKDTPIKAVFEALIKATGLPEGNAALVKSRARIRNLPILPRAWHAGGDAIDELHAFARATGWTFSIKDGALEFLEIGVPLFESGPLLAPHTGLVGAPSADTEGNVSVTALLLPDVRPGHAFRVEYPGGVSGNYFAEATTHEGDTRGDQWHTRLDGKPLVAGFKPSPGIQVNT